MRLKVIPFHCIHRPGLPLPLSVSGWNANPAAHVSSLRSFPETTSVVCKSPLAHPELFGCWPLAQMPLFHFVQHLQPIPFLFAQ